MTDMSTSPRHLVIMAAGTGGHIMPGLAVADEMKRRGWTVSWLGTQGGMENRLVPPAGIPLDTISFSGLRGKGAKGALLGGFKLLKGFAEITGIRATPPHAVVHRWRFAQTQQALGQPYLYDAAQGIGLCGDWCIGHRVEDAFVSGLELALAMI